MLKPMFQRCPIKELINLFTIVFILVFIYDARKSQSIVTYIAVRFPT